MLSIQPLKGVVHMLQLDPDAVYRLILKHQTLLIRAASNYALVHNYYAQSLHGAAKHTHRAKQTISNQSPDDHHAVA